MAVFCRLQTRRDERKERERKNACEGECVNETRMIGKETGSECDRKIEHVSERAKKGDEGGGGGSQSESSHARQKDRDIEPETERERAKHSTRTRERGSYSFSCYPIFRVTSTHLFPLVS